MFSDPEIPPALRLRDAATVLLLRDRHEPDPSGFLYEVLLMRRDGAASFMAGAHVFPGGVLDPADQDPEILARVDADALARCAERLEPTPGLALGEPGRRGLCIAACRELFEESGILLARDRDGACVDLSAHDTRLRYNVLRERLNDGDISFARVLAEDDLVLDVNALVYWAHWLTPSHEPKRFDARFFLARMPDAQTSLVDFRETTEEAWLTPAEALAAAADGEVVLPPPTLRNLEDLGVYKTPDEVFDAARTRVVAPILPKIAPLDDRITVLLPWDPAYEGVDGEALDLGERHPMAEGPSRIVLEEDRWFSRPAPETEG